MQKVRLVLRERQWKRIEKLCVGKPEDPGDAGIRGSPTRKSRSRTSHIDVVVPRSPLRSTDRHEPASCDFSSHDRRRGFHQ